jgi:hypothetical protein
MSGILASAVSSGGTGLRARVPHPASIAIKPTRASRAVVREGWIIISFGPSFEERNAGLLPARGFSLLSLWHYRTVFKNAASVLPWLGEIGTRRFMWNGWPIENERQRHQAAPAARRKAADQVKGKRRRDLCAKRDRGRDGSRAE